MHRALGCSSLLLCCASVLVAKSEPVFQDDFSAGDARWTSYFTEGKWVVEDETLQSLSGDENTARLARIDPVRDVMIETRLRVKPQGRINFGVVLRAESGGSSLVLRYYDRLRSLQILSGRRDSWSASDPASEPVEIRPGQWYRLKAAVVGDLLLSKLWEDGAAEPDWLFRHPVTLLNRGGVGLITQDATRVEFDDVSIWTSGSPLDELSAVQKAEVEARDRQRRESLNLVLTASPFVVNVDGVTVRQIDVATIMEDHCAPVAGTLQVAWGDQNRRFELKGESSERGVVSLSVPEPARPVIVKAMFDAGFGKHLERSVELAPARPMSYRDYVRNCLDVLISEGLDHYGPVHSAMIMGILDVYSHVSPEQPPMLDANIRTEERPDHGRRSPGGSNLWLDQPTLGVLYRMSEITGDKKYASAADDYIAAAYKYASKPNNLLYTGSHSYHNAFTETFGGDGIHETLIKLAQWDAMHRVDPERFRRYVDALWQWHVVDKKTGLHNRHDDAKAGCDFAFSGGTFATAFAFMYKATGERDYLDKARLVTSWHYDNRSTATGLTADCPNLSGRYDGHHCFTTVSGPHAAALLRCYELTRDPYFRDAAVCYIRAFDRYGWDAKGQNYFAMLTLDGTPILKQLGSGGYDIWQPTGYVDVWRTTMYSYEMPLIAAETAVYAWRLCDDPSDKQAMLESARHWARVIEASMPARSGRRWARQLEQALPRARETGGTYAENYGRAISFFVGLYRADGDAHYLDMAKSLAHEAIQKLYANGLFRGHPAKDFYQANDGVGFLLHALLQLDALPSDWELAF